MSYVLDDIYGSDDYESDDNYQDEFSDEQSLYMKGNSVQGRDQGVDLLELSKKPLRKAPAKKPKKKTKPQQRIIDVANPEEVEYFKNLQLGEKYTGNKTLEKVDFNIQTVYCSKITASNLQQSNTVMLSYNKEWDKELHQMMYLNPTWDESKVEESLFNDSGDKLFKFKEFVPLDKHKNIFRREGFASTTFRNHIVVHGGVDHKNTLHNELALFDPITQKVTIYEDFGPHVKLHAFKNHAMVNHHDQSLLIFGACYKPNYHYCSSTPWGYTHVPNEMIITHIKIELAHHNKAYAGYKGRGEHKSVYFESSRLNASNAFIPRCENFSIATVNAKHYLFGGVDNNITFDHLFSVEYISHTPGIVVTRFEKNGTCWPTKRHSHSSVEVNGNIILYGGAYERTFLNDLYFFDASIEKWKEVQVNGIAPCPVSSYGGLFNFGNQFLYMYGGMGFNNKRKTVNDTLYRFDIFNKRWLVVQTADTNACMKPCHNHQSVVLNNCL
ncbi:tRNA wybutosine-synthesizing protein [Acrasis kona]|uniref:tRNA wybutosine-synthesizing protein n=1 Tax=Acrasis kona TaxID=1008807 RepID=A0AAW2Z6A9_9EUKA